MTRIGAGQAANAMFAGLGHGGRDFSAVIQKLRGRLDELEGTAA